MATRYFISHAYSDQAALNKLVGVRLPAEASPFIFPSITVTPEQRVSDDLVRAVADCDGLIYLQDDATLRSFWCGFERNLALQLGKPVYGFDTAAGVFTRDTAAPVDPIVACVWNSYVEDDTDLVWKIVVHLNETRNFRMGRHHPKLYSPEVQHYSQIMDDEWDLKSKLDRGGSVLMLLSNEGLTCGWLRYLNMTEEDPVPRPSRDKFALFPKDRTLFAWLDPPDRGKITQHIASMAGDGHWKPYFDVVCAALGEPNPLVLANNRIPNWNRIDDLMVRVAYASFKTKPSQHASGA